MTDTPEWEIKDELQPKPGDVAYDLDRALSSIVGLRTQIPEDAFTASVLGTERAGNGVIIDDSGLVLTIGYLITEAESVWLVGGDGRVSPGHVVAYDQETGFGLVQALAKLGLPALERGRSADIWGGETVVMGGFGGRAHSVRTQVTARHEFAGYWEYVLDEAIFTAPPHPNWGGAGLIGPDGRLIGIGSLFVQDQRPGGGPVDQNMIVPIDLLDPVLDELLQFGRPHRPPRPWLGMYTAEAEDQFVVVGLAEDGPADQAGIEVGDRVLEVDGELPVTLADMFRRVWALGKAGVQVPLTIWRDGQSITIGVPSADRTTFLKVPKLH